MVSPNDVVMAYRLLLGREPENDSVVQHHAQASPDLATLRRNFLQSAEFDFGAIPRLPTHLDLGTPMRVDVDVDDGLLGMMMDRIEVGWSYLGKVDPFWSVLSSDLFKVENFNDNAKLFYNSARNEIDRMSTWLSRNGICDFGPGHTCSEYGCGTGRVTAELASRFSRVLAYDISLPHLSLAEQYLQCCGHTNVSFQHVGSRKTLKNLEPTDMIFSFMVLQHNPPPVISYVLTSLLESLKPSGIAYFQVPTYCSSYEFVAKKYVEQPARNEIEVHFLPQRHILAIAKKAGCAVLEIQPDNFLGQPHCISNTFLLRKNAV